MKILLVDDNGNRIKVSFGRILLICAAVVVAVVMPVLAIRYLNGLPNVKNTQHGIMTMYDVEIMPPTKVRDELYILTPVQSPYPKGSTYIEVNSPDGMKVIQSESCYLEKRVFVGWYSFVDEKKHGWVDGIVLMAANRKKKIELENATGPEGLEAGDYRLVMTTLGDGGGLLITGYCYFTVR